MDHEVVNVQLGQPRYEELVGQLRGDPDLLERMWRDAEHRLEERLGKVWTFVVVRSAGRWVPAAWAAACVQEVDGSRVLVCGDNYERPGPGRGLGLYPLAYRHRHVSVVEPAGLPAVTYLFAQPIRLHEADGWYRTGLCGTSRQPGCDPHEWWQLRRPAGRTVVG